MQSSSASLTAVDLAELSDEQMDELLSSLTLEQRIKLEGDWDFWARPKQRLPAKLPNGLDWVVWLILAGRGFGKTRTGAETVRQWAHTGLFPFITLIGPTAGDMRDAMIEGESGVLATAPNDFRPLYEPSKRRLTWPNGVRGLCLSADEPDRFRNKQHMKIWADELAAWRYPESWDQAMFGLRIGPKPQAVATTTPRPTKLIKELINDTTTFVTHGTSYENLANLSPVYVQKVIRKYEGTRLGRQELNAEIMEDTDGALWTRKMFEDCRVDVCPPTLKSAVAIDPSVAADGGGDECGIVTGGVALCGCKVAKGGRREQHVFVTEDLSGSMSPNAWATVAVNVLQTQKLDRAVAEVNNGGGLVETTLRGVKNDDGEEIGQDIPYTAVHASVGKRARAEPVSALYEQGKVHHVGSLPKLEDECCTWNPMSGRKSPNRLDALVWLVTHLKLEPPKEKTVAENWADAQPEEWTDEDSDDEDDEGFDD